MACVKSREMILIFMQVFSALVFGYMVLNLNFADFTKPTHEI
jgi:hypothetical protein